MRAARDASVHKQAGRVYEYDRAFSPVKISDILGGDTSFAYNPNGQVTKAVNETTGDTSAGVPGTGAQRPTAANLEERFDYDAARNLAGASASAPDATFGAGLTNLTRFQSTPGGVTQIARGPRGEKIALDHDECGRVIKRRVHRDGFRPQVWLYTWDVHDRLVGCTDPDGVRWVYAYGPFGRRLSKQRRFSEQELIYARARWPELVADQPDLPERGSHYLREMAPGGHQPGNKTPPVTGTFYMWDGDQMVQEAPLRLDGTIDERAAIRWHYEEGDHTPLAKQLPDGTLHYIVTDHLGTPKEMFDEAGNLVWSASHYVWGAVRAVKMYGGGAGAAPAWQGKQGASLVPARERTQAEGAAREQICPFRFPGQYEDQETGLNYNRHRYYDVLTGQYCSPDPIGLAGGDRPQGYVDRPGSWVDPLGLAARLHPQGITPRQFDAMSSKIRAHADSRGLGDDIFVQGSRANGSAKASSDVDIAIRVPADKFDQIMNDPIIVRKRLSNPNPTSSAMKTRNEAIKQGRIHAGEARLSRLAKEIEGMIGKPVDISIIRAGGPFDNGPQIPLSFGF